ncbi:MAG: polysaccharide pyruvyl transferase family protein, partial [Chloroflexi bacterium]|nr:polysaccharide pyruvyl transferase family protein [Chloroflexota bacterium]
TVADLYPHATINGLFSLALAKSLGAAAYSVNETVAVKDPVLSYLIKQVYNKIDGVIVREPMSKDRLVEIGVRPEKIAVGADCAILVDDFDEEKAEKIAERFGVGEGCIGLILRGDMSPDLAFWTSAINEIEARFARKVVFFSSCEVTDLGFGRLLKERLGTTVVEGMDDYSVFVPFLKRFGAIVTQRYHPIYFSIIVGVPFVPLLGNTFKAQGLLKHFDYPCPVLESPSVEQLVSALEQVLLNSDALRPHLARIHARLVELAWLNVSMLRKHA